MNSDAEFWHDIEEADMRARPERYKEDTMSYEYFWLWLAGTVLIAFAIAYVVTRP